MCMLSHLVIPDKSLQSLQSVMSDFWDPTDYSPTCSSVHGILLARILEWVALLSSRGSADGSHVIICASMPNCNEVSIIPWDVLGALWKIPRITRGQKIFHLGLLWWLSGKSACQGRRHGFWHGQILMCESTCRRSAFLQRDSGTPKKIKTILVKAKMELRESFPCPTQGNIPPQKRGVMSECSATLVLQDITADTWEGHPQQHQRPETGPPWGGRGKIFGKMQINMSKGMKGVAFLRESNCMPLGAPHWKISLLCPQEPSVPRVLVPHLPTLFGGSLWDPPPAMSWGSQVD